MVLSFQKARIDLGVKIIGHIQKLNTKPALRSLVIASGTLFPLDFQEIVDNIRKKVIQSSLKMGGCQYLRDYRMAQRLQKTAELRKRVMERNKKHSQKLPEK